MSRILFEEFQRYHSQNCTHERSLYTTVKMIPIKHFKLERELCGSLLRGGGGGGGREFGEKNTYSSTPSPLYACYAG